MRLPSLHTRIFLLILLVGAVLRFFSLSYGLPRLYLEDEEFFVSPALRVAEGHLNPGWFGAPAQPLIYALAGTFRIVNIGVNFAHKTHATVSQNYHDDPTPFQTAGRVWPALAGTALIAVVYALAAFWNRRAGLWAAGITATSFFLVDHSHIIRPDIAQTLFLLLTMLGCMHVLRNPHRWRPYLLVGVSFGLSVGMKYPSLFVLPMFAAIAFALWRRHRFFWRRWTAAGATAIATTFLTGPFLFIDFRHALLNVATENRSEHGGHDGFGFLGNLWWYLRDVLSWQIGTFLLLFTGATIAWWAVRRVRARSVQQHDAIILLAFGTALIYLVGISMLHLHWSRWNIPVMTMLFILTGIGVERALCLLRRRRALAIVLVLTLFLAPAIRLIRTFVAYGKTHTIESARSWSLDHLPKQSTIVIEPFAPKLPKDDYHLISLPNATWHTPDRYSTENVEYVIVTGKVYGVIREIAARKNPKRNFVKATHDYEELFGKSLLIQEFLPHPRFTENQLLYSDDWSVLRMLDLSFSLGPFVKIYALPQ